MNRGTDWIRWIVMAVLAAAAVYFFLFATRGLPPAPMPAEGSISDPLLAASIQGRLQAINQSPDKLEPRLGLCMTYEANSLPHLAESCYRQITSFAPDHPRAWYQLGHVLHRQGDQVGALSSMRTAATLAGENPFPNWQVGLLLLEVDQGDKAVLVFEKARGALGDDPTLLANLMEAHVQAQRPQVALDLATEFKLTDSTISPWAHNLMARAHEALGNQGEAEAALLLASDGPPPMADGWMVEVANHIAGIPALKARLNAAVRTGKWTQVAAMIQTLNTVEAPTRETRLIEATALAKTGSPEEAVQVLKPLVAQTPDDPLVQMGMANVQLELAARRQDLAQAETALATAHALLNANPNNVAAHGVCVRALELLDRPEEAVAACRAAWRVSNNPQPLSLAAALIAREEIWRDNEDLLRALWMVQPNHPAVGSLLVLSLVEQGQVSQARSILESLTSASLDGRYLSRAREAVTKASAGR